jgi:hypothetical protein
MKNEVNLSVLIYASIIAYICAKSVLISFGGFIFCLLFAFMATINLSFVVRKSRERVLCTEHRNIVKTEFILFIINNIILILGFFIIKELQSSLWLWKIFGAFMCFVAGTFIFYRFILVTIFTPKEMYEEARLFSKNLRNTWTTKEALNELDQLIDRNVTFARKRINKFIFRKLAWDNFLD